MYSLVTPSVLVGDLASRPDGQRLVAFVHEVMLLHDEAVPVLAAAAAELDPVDLEQARQAALRTCEGEETITEVLRRADAQLLEAAVDEVAAEAGTLSSGPLSGDHLSMDSVAGHLAGTADQLAAAMFGDVPTLVRFVGDELLELKPWRDVVAPLARAAVRDELLALWSAGKVDQATTKMLSYAWRTARARAPRWSMDRREVLGPQVGECTRLCSQLRQLDRTHLERLLEMHSQVTGWAELMHSAAWAAHLSGRLRAVTIAQLAAGAAVLQSASKSGWSQGSVRSLLAPVCGTITAEVLADLLDDVTYWGLTGAYTAVRADAA